MTLGEHVFQYCERGTDTALWAEPLNAVSNAGFFLAALIFWQCLLWRPREQRSADHYLLIALVFLIGLGSLAFHLFATAGTELADVIPITVFMLVYLGVALNRFLSVPPGWTVLLVAGFAGLMAAAAQVHCWDGGIGLAGTVEGSKTCLNGSMSYLPALAAMIIVGMLAAERRHRAAPYVLGAAVVFIVSVLLRSLDFVFCDEVTIDGRDVGTHFMWHLLNAVVIFLLLRATLETGFKEVPLEESGPAPVPALVKAAEPEFEPEPEPDPADEPEPVSEREPEELEDSLSESPEGEEHAEEPEDEGAGESEDEAPPKT
jgi:hypothetical protein